MNTKKMSWSFWAVVLFVTIGTIAYVYDVSNGTVETTVVTWIVLITASLLNLCVAVLKDGRSAFTLNIMIIMGAIGQSVCLVSVLIADASTNIALLDIAVLGGSFAGFAIYMWRREYAVISVIAINVAIVIGFIPLWINLWNGGVTESLIAWACITVAASFGFQKPLCDKKYVALVYPLRSTLTSGIVVGLSLWNMYS